MIRLTGKRRYRSAEDGSIILQVQEDQYFRTNHGPLPMPDTEPTWRDARMEDLTQHER